MENYHGDSSGCMTGLCVRGLVRSARNHRRLWQSLAAVCRPQHELSPLTATSFVLHFLALLKRLSGGALWPAGVIILPQPSTRLARSSFSSSLVANFDASCL